MKARGKKLTEANAITKHTGFKRVLDLLRYAFYIFFFFFCLRTTFRQRYYVIQTTI